MLVQIVSSRPVFVDKSHQLMICPGINQMYVCASLPKSLGLSRTKKPANSSSITPPTIHLICSKNVMGMSAS